MLSSSSDFHNKPFPWNHQQGICSSWIFSLWGLYLPCYFFFTRVRADKVNWAQSQHWQCPWLHTQFKWPTWDHLNQTQFFLSHPPAGLGGEHHQGLCPWEEESSKSANCSDSVWNIDIEYSSGKSLRKFFLRTGKNFHVLIPGELFFRIMRTFLFHPHYDELLFELNHWFCKIFYSLLDLTLLCQILFIPSSSQS